MNMTHKRVALLSLVKGAPGLKASKIAEDLFPRMSSDGRTNYGWSAQGATRFGCGYAQPLVNAGLLRKDVHVRGGARYYLTDKGEAALREAIGEPFAQNQAVAGWPFPRVAS